MGIPHDVVWNTPPGDEHPNGRMIPTEIRTITWDYVISHETYYIPWDAP